MNRNINASLALLVAAVAVPVGGIYAHHYTTSQTYTPGQTVYVSNTWNHMMDTLDTNSSLAKVRVP